MGARDPSVMTESGNRLMRRRLHPLDPKTPLFLRRVCGTCAAFPAGAEIRAEGQNCARLCITVNGARNAADCKHWARKGPPVK